MSNPEISQGRVAGVFADIAGDFDQLIMHDREAKVALALGMVLGGNVILMGGPSGGKTTLANNANRAVEGLDNNVVIPPKVDLRVSQLLGNENVSERAVTDPNGLTTTEVIKYTQRSILTEGTQTAFADEFNQLPSHISASLAGILEEREFINSEGNRKASNMEYMIAAQNPYTSGVGQFNLKPSIATRFGIGAFMGYHSPTEKREIFDAKRGRNGAKWASNPDAMQGEVKLAEMHAAREYIKGDAIAQPASLDDYMFNKLLALSAATIKLTQGENDMGRMEEQLTLNTKGLAAANEQSEISPEFIDQAADLVLGSRVGPLGREPKADYENARNQVHDS